MKNQGEGEKYKYLPTLTRRDGQKARQPTNQPSNQPEMANQKIICLQYAALQSTTNSFTCVTRVAL